MGSLPGHHQQFNVQEHQRSQKQQQQSNGHVIPMGYRSLPENFGSSNANVVSPSGPDIDAMGGHNVSAKAQLFESLVNQKSEEKRRTYFPRKINRSQTLHLAPNDPETQPAWEPEKPPPPPSSRVRVAAVHPQPQPEFQSLKIVHVPIVQQKTAAAPQPQTMENQQIENGKMENGNETDQSAMSLAEKTRFFEKKIAEAPPSQPKRISSRRANDRYRTQPVTMVSIDLFSIFKKIKLSRLKIFDLFFICSQIN